jgi:hypothetical protein
MENQRVRMIAICRTARNCQEACQRLTWPGEHGPHGLRAGTDEPATHGAFDSMSD